MQLNNQKAIVIALTSDTITVPIASQNYSPFIFLPENEQVYPAMVVPAGSGIIPGAFPAQTNLADAFDNVPNN
jgi:hypothetical protein